MKPLAFVGILTASSVWGQSSGSLRARELFYTPVPAAQTSQTPDPPKPTKQAATPTAPKQAAPKQAKATAPTNDAIHTLQAAAVPLGLRYAVLKRDAADKYQEVDPDTPFRAGDRIRLQINSNTSGYLYIVMQGSSGTWQLLFPSAEVSGGSNHVDTGQSLQIPPGGRGQFLFDETAGTEKIFLVLTRQPEPDLDKLIYSMQGRPAPDSAGARVVLAQATLKDDLINRLRSGVQARDLVFEKVDASKVPPSGARVENAAYVVNPSTAQDARLVVDVALKHR